MYAFDYQRPAGRADAVALAQGEARYLAGGQSLVQAMKLRLSSSEISWTYPGVLSPTRRLPCAFPYKSKTLETKVAYEIGHSDATSDSIISRPRFSRVNRSYSNRLAINSAVTSPSGVRPVRLRKKRGIQCVSGVIAIAGCASTMRWSSVVPDLGQPTIKTYGFIEIVPSTLLGSGLKR